MLNRVILMGRLTKNPETRYINDNVAVSNFTLAVERNFKRQNEKNVDFIDIVAFGKTAEFISKWFFKGMQVAVSGRIQTKIWEDKQNIKHNSFQIITDEVYFADSKKTSSQESNINMSNINLNNNSEMSIDDSDFHEILDDDVPF